MDAADQQKVAAGGGRSKLSLRRKKDKDPPPPPLTQAQQPHPSSSPPPNPTNLSLRITPCDILTIITPKASKTVSTTHSGEKSDDEDPETRTHHDKSTPTCMKKQKLASTESSLEYTTNDGTIEYALLYEEGKEISTDKDEDKGTEMELQHGVSSPPPEGIDDDIDDDDVGDGGLGDLYFCHICQKDLIRFSESRRQTHINRCCDKQEEEEEKESAAAAKAAKEAQNSALACLLCEKSFKSDSVRLKGHDYLIKARMTHLKLCAKSKGVAPDRLVQLMRESKMDSAANSVMQESGSSSRVEQGGGEGEKPLQARRSKRLVGQSRKVGKGAETTTTTLPKEDEDFAMPPPVSRPVGRRGRKRKRDNLQDNYLEELEEEQVRLAIALSASMESGGDAVPPAYGGETSHTKGRKRQKRKNAAAEVVPPLLTVTTEKANDIINQRAEEILSRSGTAANNTGALEPDNDDDDDIPCTPAFPESELGGGGGNGYSSKPASSSLMKPGTTAVDGQDGRVDDDDEEEVLLLEDGDEKRLEINDELAVKLCDAACPAADTDASPKSTDGVSFKDDNKETGPIQADSVAKSGEKVAEDDEAMSLGEGSEHSESEDTPLHVAMETGATELGVSFHEDLQEVDYPTLWQLTAEQTHSVEHFYVPALVPVISPIKAEQREREVEGPSLAPTLPAVPTIPMEDYHWEEKVSPIQQTTEINRVHPAISQLLSDLGGLVGSSLFSDVQIQTGSGSVIPAHAVILAARCPKLKQVIEQSQTTPTCISLGFSDIDDDSILAFLHFIYTGSSPTETDDNVDLRRNFSLLLERWYGNEHGGKKDDKLLPLDQESLWLKSASSSRLRDSTVTTANPGRALELQVNVASPRHHGTLQRPKSESPQSNERAHPVAGEEEGENPVIIENSDDSDNSALGIKNSPTSNLKDQEQHTEIKNSPGIHDIKFDSHAKEGSPVMKIGDTDRSNNNHLTRYGHNASNESSLELERDCILRGRRRRRELEGAGESVRHSLSSDWSQRSSHISLSSVDSNEVVICKPPTTLLSPGGAERGGEDSSSSSDLFHPSPDHYADSECIGEGEREGGTVEGGEEESERIVESIIVESSSSSRASSVALITSLHSPRLIEKQEKASRDNRLPGTSTSTVSIPEFTIPDIVIPEISIPDIVIPEISVPDVSISNISVPDVTTPDVSVPHVTTPDFSLPDYSPVNDYSFGAFDDDIVSYPSASLEQEPVEPTPLKLVTPVNNRTVTVVPESVDTVKRKSQSFKTPASCGVELQTDDDITPLPDFRGMRTPCLKGECARFGMKAMAKKKMIAKLSEIYEHTHPLVDAEGRIVSADSESLEDSSNTKTTKQRSAADKPKTKVGRAKKAGVTEGSGVGQKRAAQGCSIHELKMAVLEYLKSDKQLYQDILLFKPMELSYFCTKVKSAGISVTKEKLADILDNLCITYTVPRQQRSGKKSNQERIS